MRQEQIIANNLLVSYFKIENAGNKCLLFLHGWRSNKEVWQGVIKDLGLKVNDADFYALDLPGFGGSQTSSEAMTVGDYAEAVKEFIEKLQLKNVVIIGHSFGGRVGIKLTSQHPDIVSKLVLVDSAGFAMEKYKKKSIGFIAKIAKPFFKPQFMRGFRKNIYKAMGSEDYIATPHLQKTFLHTVNEDLTSCLSQIKCPTQIVWGKDDKETPLEFGEKMLSLIPNSRLQILKQAGHFSFLDQPSEFVEAVSTFVNA